MDYGTIMSIVLDIKIKKTMDVPIKKKQFSTIIDRMRIATIWFSWSLNIFRF